MRAEAKPWAIRSNTIPFQIFNGRGRGGATSVRCVFIFGNDFKRISRCDKHSCKQIKSKAAKERERGGEREGKREKAREREGERECDRTQIVAMGLGCLSWGDWQQCFRTSPATTGPSVVPLLLPLSLYLLTILSLSRPPTARVPPAKQIFGIKHNQIGATTRENYL